MEDLQSTLQSILSDPEQMRQIAAMAESLGLKPPAGNGAPGHSERSEESVPHPGHSERSEEPVSHPRHSERSEESVSPGSGPPHLGHSERSDESVPFPLPDLSALTRGLSAMQGTEDRVFGALRPSLSPAGQGKADRATRAAKLARLASRFLTRQRDGHV